MSPRPFRKGTSGAVRAPENWTSEPMTGDRALERLIAATGAAVVTCPDGDGRRALADSLARAMVGTRVVVRLDAPALAASLDALRVLSGRMLPVVLFVDSRPLVDQVVSSGSAHDVLHAAADAGAIVLCPADPQGLLDDAILALRTAETALCPVVVGVDADVREETMAVSLPADALAATLFGLASDAVPAASPAQARLLGDPRRRVPRWFDGSRPLLLGAAHTPELAGFAAVGRQLFHTASLAPLLARVRKETADVAGHAAPAFHPPEARKKRLVVCVGSLLHPVRAAATSARATVLGIDTLSPLPDDLLAPVLDATDVFVLEGALPGVDGTGPLTRLLATRLAGALRTASKRRRRMPSLHAVFAGLGGAPVREADIRALLARDALPDGPVFLGAALAADPSADPKRHVLVQGLHRDDPEAASRLVRGDVDAGVSPPSPTTRELPVSLRHMRRTDDFVDSLPRFWSQVGIALQEGRAGALCPDPFLATGSVPAHAATLFRRDAPADGLPHLVTDRCTGCGHCWTGCPEGAIGVTVLPLRALLEDAWTRSQAAGAEVSALKPLLERVATRLHRLVREADVPPPSLDAMATEAFEWVLSKRGDTPERAAALREAFDAIEAELSGTPWVRTDPFFVEPDAMEAGAGALLTLAVDPNRCTACGVCVRECEPEALVPGPPTPHTAETWERWLSLPDTTGAIVTAARAHPGVGDAAGTLLTRHALFAFDAGRSEADTAAVRLALRLLYAGIESVVQPSMLALVRRLRDAEASLSERLRNALADALPTSDLDALSQGLALFEEGDVTIAALASRVESATRGGRLDAGELRRRIADARALADDRWQLETGPTGLGRARAGTVLMAGPRTSALARVPAMGFAGPVFHDATHTAPRVAAELADAALAETTALVTRLRAAETDTTDETPAPLAPAERTAVPPVLLIAEESALTPSTWGQTRAALRSGRPLVVIFLAEQDADANAALDALALDGVAVVQSSVGAPDHVTQHLRAALRSGRAALLRIHTPKPDAADPAGLVETARRAIECGTFPLFAFQPERAEGPDLDVTGNPDPEAIAAQLVARLPLVAAFADRAASHARSDADTSHTAAEAALRAEIEETREQVRRDTEAALLARLTEGLLAYAVDGLRDEPNGEAS